MLAPSTPQKGLSCSSAAAHGADRGGSIPGRGLKETTRVNISTWMTPQVTGEVANGSGEGVERAGLAPPWARKTKPTPRNHFQRHRPALFRHKDSPQKGTLSIFDIALVCPLLIFAGQRHDARAPGRDRPAHFPGQERQNRHREITLNSIGQPSTATMLTTSVSKVYPAGREWIVVSSHREENPPW